MKTGRESRGSDLSRAVAPFVDASHVAVVKVPTEPGAPPTTHNFLIKADPSGAAPITIGADGKALSPIPAERIHDESAARGMNGGQPLPLEAYQGATLSPIWPPHKSAVRMLSETGYALEAEVERGRTKFPGGRFLLAALVEEVGELAWAIAEGKPKAIREEAIQVAAVAVRIAEEGDATAYHPDRMISLIHATGGVARGLLQRKAEAVNFHLYSLLTRARAMVGDGDPTFDDITDEEAKP